MRNKTLQFELKSFWTQIKINLFAVMVTDIKILLRIPIVSVSDIPRWICYCIHNYEVFCYLMHRVHGEHHEHMHDVVRVEAAIHGAREPFLWDMHGADHAAAQRHRVLQCMRHGQTCYVTRHTVWHGQTCDTLYCVAGSNIWHVIFVARSNMWRVILRGTVKYVTQLTVWRGTLRYGQTWDTIKFCGTVKHHKSY